uniref:Si:ch211-81a5.8 n=1 Tax=Sinocyclocheilus rhinocerous TaxID=307959 RepID=A0A673IAU1_9TELE
MDAVVKKSRGAPFRQLTSCVRGDKDGFRRKGKTVRRKSAPCCYGQTAHDSSWLRIYQTELHGESRKLRQVKFAQRNRNEGTLHTASRRYGKHKHKHSKTPTKSDNSLFGAFKGLSLNMNGAQTSITTPPYADPCKVM